MLHYEGVFGFMNAVLYYSDAGECKRIAEYVASKTNYELFDITAVTDAVCEFAVLVFPVYCQNVPKTVKRFLSQLQTKYLIVIAAYGKMSCGNVLWEIQRKYKHNVIGAAYVPTKHAYLNEPRFCDFEKLNPLIEKLRSPKTVAIPRRLKNLFANFAPELRSRIGVKIVKNDACRECGKCESVCEHGAIKNGRTNGRCVRCTKCAVNCPSKALSVKLNFAMKKYLNKKKKTETEIFV